MKISNNFKKRLNNLIPHYRNIKLREFKSGEWQQYWFYRDENNTSICSSKIYCALENDQIIAKDYIYEFCIKKLRKFIREDKQWDLLIENTSKILVYLVDFNKMDKIENLIRDSILFMEKFNNYIYYEEVLWVFEKLYDFYTSYNISMTEVEFYDLIDIFTVFEGYFRDIVLHLLYNYALYHDVSLLKFLFDKIVLEDSYMESNEIIYVKSDIFKERYVKALARYKDFENKIVSEQNDYQLLILYIEIASLLSLFDRKESCLYLKRSLHLLDIYNKKSEINPLVYKTIGEIYLLFGDYEVSLSYFNKVLLYSISSLSIQMYIYISHISHMIENNLIFESYECLNISQVSRLDKNMYIYFEEYSKRTTDANKKYILKKIMPLLNVYNFLYIKLVEQELWKSCTQGKGYKAWYEFKKIWLNKKNGEIEE